MSARGKILVVDDSPVVLLATARGLRDVGYEVLEAGTGQECLQAARAHHPDLILLDVMLPDMEGPAVCRLIKADPELRGIFVVLISTLCTDTEFQAKGLEGGADGYIARPVAGRELRARVEALLRIQRAEEALRQAQHDLERQVEARTAELKQANASLVREIEDRRRAEQAVLDSRALLIAVFKSLHTEVAVLDKEGVMIAVNQAWMRFASENSAVPGTVSEGANYLDACRRSMARGDLGAGQALEGIQGVLHGSRPQFLLEYSCDSPTVTRWFLMTVTVLESTQGGAVVAHKDITELKETQKSLQKALDEVGTLRDQLAQENVYL
ncbi:MAG: response regulator, partial [Verrucomicrobia bacterium]|nr:response regulator [Verrucomicrobiota bacterium]